MKLDEVFERLKREYECIMESDALRLAFNPVKKIIDLEFENGVSVERVSVLTAKTLSGKTTVKQIHVDDRDSTYEEYITCGEDTLIDKGVTTYRCGLMTALCIDRLSSVLDNRLYGMRVGFIGCGRTNLQNCKTIHELYAISKVVIRGSERNRGKNKDLFKQVVADVQVDDTNDLKYLNQCDVVVVCTSSFEKENLISYDKLSDVKLIIVLDCGYVLDESFRQNRISFTDHIEQISHYYEFEFPFDEEKECHFLQMKKDILGGLYGEKAVVYLHGIALADAIVSEEMLRDGKPKKETGIQ